MDEQDFCKSCGRKNQCQEIYRQLGNAKQPSVAVKVILAFLMPMVVFIVSLAAFQKILVRAFDAEGLQTAFSLLLAVGSTAGCVLLVWLINKSGSQNKN